LFGIPWYLGVSYCTIYCPTDNRRRGWGSEPPLAVRMGVLAARDALHIRRIIGVESRIAHTIGIHVLSDVSEIIRACGGRGGGKGRPHPEPRSQSAISLQEWRWLTLSSQHCCQHLSRIIVMKVLVLRITSYLSAGLNTQINHML